MLLYVITIAVIIGIGAMCLVFASDDEQTNIKFLESYGWEVDNEYTEKVTFEIPEVFDEVYNNYNELQKISGLNLAKYKGRKAVRYTYIVLNFPQDTKGENVFANVLCVAGEPVAGDVMTVRLDGFMYSLSYLKTGK